MFPSLQTKNKKNYEKKTKNLRYVQNQNFGKTILLLHHQQF